jgi:hypothetical protein
MRPSGMPVPGQRARHKQLTSTTRRHFTPSAAHASNPQVVRSLNRDPDMASCQACTQTVRSEGPSQRSHPAINHISAGHTYPDGHFTGHSKIWCRTTQMVLAAAVQLV